MLRTRGTSVAEFPSSAFADRLLVKSAERTVYIPSSFAERDLPTLHAFIDAHPLATLVTTSASDELMATHLPLVLDRDAGPSGTLIGHIARANPHARCVMDGADRALVIFTGPEAYIRPGWYPSKRETGRVVPTWNYIAVHAYGTIQLRDDPAFLRRHLESLTARHESGRPRPWSIDDAPAGFIEQQMKAVVALEIAIDRLEGKWKMSQNRSAADISGVVHGLEATGTIQNHAVAAVVRARRPAKP